MIQKILFVAALACILAPTAPQAQTTAQKILPLDGQIAQNGQMIELNWFDADPPRVGPVRVKRRLYGRIGGETWETVADNLGPVMRYRDETVKPGIAYEYQVLRYGRDLVDVGYWLAGTELPARPARGTAYVVVDETLAEDLTPHLNRFARDLLGDGWRVLARTAPRGLHAEPTKNLQNAVPLKRWLVDQFNQDPFGTHAIILVGHIPLITSGRANPDGHDPQPHPTDLFYADMDGVWNITPEGLLTNNRLPGDFIEAQIGRIDFSNVSEGNGDVEKRLIRAYFDKNHHWRMGILGDLREAYAQSDHLPVEQSSLRNVVGQSAITPGGHHDVGEERPWLWGVDFGAWNGPQYATAYRNKAVFAINFGSGKQMIGNHFNPMTAHLAQPWYTLAVGWGARPAWWLHHMALGGSVGEMHMRTVNNGRFGEPYRESMDYHPTGLYMMRNPVWVNLLGDPTLRAFPLQPAAQATAQRTSQGVTLSWQPSPDPDVLGYHVWRIGPDQQITALTRQGPVAALQFTDPKPQEGAGYMIRAYGLKEVYAGSFHTLSQAVFADVDTPLETDTALLAPQISVPTGQASPLPERFNTVSEGRIFAVIGPPALGRLDHDGTGWRYTPRSGFTGTDTLRFSVSGPGGTREGQLRIEVVQ